MNNSATSAAFKLRALRPSAEHSKRPSLRNVAISGPYMHDGKLKTLKDVIDFYAGAR